MTDVSLPPLPAAWMLLLSRHSISNHRHRHCRAMIRMTWDPLPPRRSHNAASLIRDEDALLAKQPPEVESPAGTAPTTNPGVKSTPARQRNRPGFNSYLKVNMEDCVLHNLSQTLQTLTNEYEKVVNDQEATSITSKRCKIKPRSLESLHLTLFFGGETLCQLDKGHLEDLHARFTSVVQDSGFVGATILNSPAKDTGCPALSGTEMSTGVSPGNFWFTIKEFRVFPPRRNNLLVAVLEASPAWHDLHKALREAARGVGSDEIHQVLTYSKEQWVAHITLANVLNPNKGSNHKLALKVLQQTLRDSAFSSTNDDDSPKLFAKSISMGGPLPTQLDLNWNFPFCRLFSK